jgi:hypothetical protein
METPKCAVCGQEMRFIKAGISKSTGKPYNAFWACPDKHKQPYNTPPQATGGQPRPLNEKVVYSPTPTKEEPNWDKISWGKCKHAFLVELLKMGYTLQDAEPLAEQWADASMRKLGQPEMKDFGQGLELNQVPF